MNDKSMKLDLATIPVQRGSKYPAPFDQPCRERTVQRLGDAACLTHLGVTRARLAPGAWSSQRHWHAAEDEFLYMIEGEAVLVMDDHEEIVRAGDCVGWKAGVRNGHTLQNRSDREAVFLAISNCSNEDWGEYPDIDLKFSEGRYSGTAAYLHKDGTPY